VRDANEDLNAREEENTIINSSLNKQSKLSKIQHMDSDNSNLSPMKGGMDVFVKVIDSAKEEM